MNRKHLRAWLAVVVLSAASATSMAQSSGMGAGMMDGAAGQGMGPGMKHGMMGGDGPASCGHHMMEGGMAGGSGHGMGMMSGKGPNMGAGMMAGHAGHLPPDLTDKQRSAINKVHDEFAKKQWELGGKLLDEHPRLRDLYEAQPRDPKAIGAQYAKIFDVRRQMIELTIDMHNRVDAMFTKEQRAALHQQGSRRGPMKGQ